MTSKTSQTRNGC